MTQAKPSCPGCDEKSAAIRIMTAAIKEFCTDCHYVRAGASVTDQAFCRTCPLHPLMMAKEPLKPDHEYMEKVASGKLLDPSPETQAEITRKLNI